RRRRLGGPARLRVRAAARLRARVRRVPGAAHPRALRALSRGCGAPRERVRARAGPAAETMVLGDPSGRVLAATTGVCPVNSARADRVVRPAGPGAAGRSGSWRPHAPGP